MSKLLYHITFRMTDGELAYDTVTGEDILELMESYAEAGEKPHVMVNSVFYGSD